MLTSIFSVCLEGKEHILRIGQHPHLEHHRSAVCGAMVPSHPAQRSHKGSRRRRRENYQRVASPQIPLPNHEHPAHGAVQRVRRVRHQQLPHPVRRAGARAEREE